MKRFIRNFILILLALIIIAVVAVVLMLDTLIVKGVTTFVPPITQTSVELGAVHTSLLNGTASIHNFKLGSPKGFQSTLFSLGEVSVAVDLKSLTTDTIIVKEVKISDVRAAVEFSTQGTNIGALLKNLEAATASANKKPAQTTKKEPAQKGASKKVIIKKIIFERGTLTVAAYGNEIDVPLPNVTMTDIGADKKESKNAVQIFAEVVTRYSKAVLNAATTAATNIVKGGKELIGKGLEQAQQGVAKGLGKAQEGVAKGLNKAQQGVSKGLGAVTDTVNSLFSK